MSDPKNMPVRADLQATFRAFMPRLAASFGIEPSAIQPHLADLSTADKLVAAVAFITTNPIFQAGYRMEDGSVMRQLGIAAEMLKSTDANGDEVLVGLALKMIFFHPNLGEPRMVGAIIISYDDVAVTTMGGSMTENDQSSVSYDQGLLSQLLSMLPADASGDMATLYVAMVKALNPPKGSPSEQIKAEILNEIQPFADAAPQPQPQLPAPDAEADLKAPLAADLIAVLPELMRMADETLGVDPADADALSTAFYALVADLNAKGEDLTPTTLASLLDNRDGLKFMLNKIDGKITSAALAFDLTNDAGEVIERFALGVSSDVMLPAAFSCSGLSLIVGDADENAYDPQAFSVFAKASSGLSAEKAQENRNMVIRALTAFYPFAQDDADAESLRRQAVRLLRTVMAQ